MPSLSPGREGAKVLARGNGGLELSFAAACFLLFGLVFVVVVFFALGGFPFFFFFWSCWDLFFVVPSSRWFLSTSYSPELVRSFAAANRLCRLETL